MLPHDPRSAAGELAGRTALVTGAARGIGRAVALELARRGARVVLVSRSAEELARTRASIEAGGGAALDLALDVDRADWGTQLDPRVPAIDVLVNNAAAFAPYGPLEEVPWPEVERVLRTTLISSTRLARHVVGGMKARGFGRLIQIGSVAASLGGAGQVAYSTAKAGLLGLTRTLAVEGARHGVTSNLLELGLIDTERTRSAIPPDVRAALVRNTPLGRPGTPEEVAQAVAFLASPVSAFLTGATLTLSGGLGLGLFPEQFT